MSLEKKYGCTTLLVVYIIYNAFLKLFFYLFNQLIYIDYKQKPFEQVDFLFYMEGNWLLKILRNIGINLFYDWSFLLPYTIMNLMVYLTFLRSLGKARQQIYHTVSLVILKTYLVWTIIYMCISSYWHFNKNGEFGLHIAFSPYGCYTITYFLLGNILFMFLFTPILDHLLNKNK